MHTHYKGTGKVHSFKGLLTDPEQIEISIQGSVGAITWRINKFDMAAENPGLQSQESVMQIFRERQASISAVVNYNDNELLASGYYSDSSSGTQGTGKYITIFDNALFTRNIFITHVETNGTQSCNYYIELEEVTISTAGKAQLAVAAARRKLN